MRFFSRSLMGVFLAAVTLAPDFKALDDPGTGGFAERLVSAFQWDLTGKDAGDFTLLFQAPERSMAFYEAQLDTVAGAPFVRELGRVLRAAVRPKGPADGYEILGRYGLRYESAGRVEMLLGPDDEDRFFLPGAEVELEAEANFGFRHVGWLLPDGTTAEGAENVTVTMADADAVVAAVFSPETWDDFRYHFFNHINPAMGMTADDYEIDAVSGPGADPDGDGVVNFHEYAFGGNPYGADAARLAPQAALVRAEGQDFPAITYRRQAAEDGDLTWRVEESADLRTWTHGEEVTLPVSRKLNDDGTVEVTARSRTPLTGGGRYLRVRADGRNP